MVFSVAVSSIIIVTATIVLSVLLWVIFGKISDKLILLGPVLAITLGFLFWFKCTSSIVEYKGGEEVSKSIAFFDPEIKTPDGQNVIVHPKDGKDVFIVNETDQVMALQEVYYGDRPNETHSPEIIHSHSWIQTRHVPDFYPWEDPKDQIFVNTGVEKSGTTRYWLRWEAGERR